MQLHPDEKVVIEVRRFWLPIVVRGVLMFLLGVFPIVVLAIAGSIEVIQMNMAYLTVLALSWMLIVWIIFSIMWTNYYLDVFIVTNQRLIDVDQIHLFNHDTSEMPLENVEDIRVEVFGILATVLKFGNIYIQSAGENREFALRNIYNPHRVREIISAARKDSTEDKIARY
jgi:hypothetical protein